MMPPSRWLAWMTSVTLAFFVQNASAQPDSDESDESDTASEEEEGEGDESDDDESDDDESDDDDASDEPEPKPEPPPTPAVASEVEADAEEDDGKTDHDQWVGHIGVGWFGISNVPIASGTPAGDGDDPVVNPGAPEFIPTPAIGIRYWFSSLMGLDLGLGMSVSTGSVSTTTYAADKATITSLFFHLGVPLSIVEGEHVSLQIAPETNFGYAYSEVEPSYQPGVEPPPPAQLSGSRFDVGVRVGGEVYWGFIGLPELALEGSVGVYLTHQATDITVGGAHASQDNLVFTTSEYQSPWDLFTQHVRARYYF